GHHRNDDVVADYDLLAGLPAQDQHDRLLEWIKWASSRRGEKQSLCHERFQFDSALNRATFIRFWPSYVENCGRLLKNGLQNRSTLCATLPANMVDFSYGACLPRFPCFANLREQDDALVGRRTAKVAGLPDHDGN